MIDLYEEGARKHSWWRDWRGQCVAIVASGPSAKRTPVEKLRDRIHVVAVNDSHQLVPWADVLYACESEWWVVREQTVKNFAGTRLMHNDERRTIQNVSKVTILKRRQMWVDEFQFDKAGVIGSGGNGGFQILNLVAQMGATGIALVGFDMHPNGSVHWHGLHSSPLRNPDHSRMLEWRRIMDEQAPRLKKYDVDVVNCSKESALTAFPKITIEEMLERWSL